MWPFPPGPPSQDTDAPGKAPEGAFAARYDVGRKLGAGAMADVHICQDKETGTKGAVKCIHAHRMSPVEREALVREVELMRKVGCCRAPARNIVQGGAAALASRNA